MAVVCGIKLKTPVILLVFCCILYVHQPRLFIPDDSNFPFGLYNINHMNIIAKESLLSCILSVNNQTRKVFTTKLFRFSYLLLIGCDIEICQGPQNTLSDFCKSIRFKMMMRFAYLKFILRTVIFVTTIICIFYLVLYFYNEIEMLVPVEVLEYF